jgi:hypothetical protein
MNWIRVERWNPATRKWTIVSAYLESERPYAERSMAELRRDYPGRIFQIV